MYKLSGCGIIETIIKYLVKLEKLVSFCRLFDFQIHSASNVIFIVALKTNKGFNHLYKMKAYLEYSFVFLNYYYLQRPRIQKHVCRLFETIQPFFELQQNF